MKWLQIGLMALVLTTACQKKESQLTPVAVESEELIEAVGTWEVTSPDRKQATLVLDRDGTASSKSNGEEIQGAWEVLEDQLWIFWSDGWIDLIQEDGEAYVVESYGPGTSLDANPDRTASAQKLE